MQNYVTLNISDSTLSFSVFGVKRTVKIKEVQDSHAWRLKKISDQEHRSYDY